MSTGRQVFLLLAVVVAAASGARINGQGVHGGNSGYIPQRVYDSKHKRFIDFETMLAELAKADLTFVGEQHDDPATHRLERAILEGLSRRQAPVTVSLEMFERDVQAHLDEYLAGRMSEDEFLEKSRPWPRYATDYRPLVEFAKYHGWPVIAANTPRRLASKISREGMSAVEGASPGDRPLMAAQIQCPIDDYYQRFVDTMRSHPGPNGKSEDAKAPMDPQTRAMIERFYYAQCVKDETMAESIAARFGEGPRTLVVHFNGAFHSDYGLGTAARAERRLPGSKIQIVSMVPVSDLDSVRPDEYRKKGDFIVFCLGGSRQ
ncbi:MAG: ChaN family lipoprotein [Acidobacteriota bacterium]|nr:MAG: ChaN family lipoprotein [Acidobacteriota bacterium]